MIESKGGYIACLKNNFIQDLTSEGANSLQQEFNEGKLVLVGVNKYQNKDEKIGAKIESTKNVPVKKEINPIKPLRLAYSLETSKAVPTN